ncbi:regulatory protein RecX [Nocardia fluminea]|uniref:regulatory protein RecX n=1 Tax=Nocardia fluminea TaxID=134984 RepID=UPI00372260C3
MTTPSPGGHHDSADPVEQMRRQLARLGIEVEPEPLTPVEGRGRGTADELVRSARRRRADSDARRIRSGAGDPQRAHPTGFTDGDKPPHFAARVGDDHEEWGSEDRRRSRGARRERRSARRDEVSLSTVVGGDDGRQADPVAAGSQPGEPDRRAGARRLAPGDRPDATLEQAKDACLRLLSVRARSRAELAKRLGEKGFRVEVIEAALERFTEVGLINDASFAEQWVHERHTYSGRGKKALQRELREKGVTPGDAEQALSMVTDDAEHARAADLVRRRLRTLPVTLDRDKAVRRLVGMLARRGYDQSTAFAVVTAELDEAGFDRTSARDAAARAKNSKDDAEETDLGEYAGETGRDTAAPDEAAGYTSRRPIPGDEQAAIDLVRRKLRAMPADLDRTKATRRLVDMLARRGYSSSTAFAVVKAELSQTDQ